MRAVYYAALCEEYCVLQVCMGSRGGLAATVLSRTQAHSLLTLPPTPHSLFHWEALWTGEQRTRLESYPGPEPYPEQAVAVPRRSQRVATTPHPGSLCNYGYF